MTATRRRRSTRLDGTNPRAKGTNPSAGTIDDRRRLHAMRAAMLRFVVDYFGVRYCPTCDDTGYVATRGEQVRPCPNHVEPYAREVELWHGAGWPGRLRGPIVKTWADRDPYSQEEIRERIRISFPTFPQV